MKRILTFFSVIAVVAIGIMAVAVLAKSESDNNDKNPPADQKPGDNDQDDENSDEEGDDDAPNIDAQDRRKRLAAYAKEAHVKHLEPDRYKQYVGVPNSPTIKNPEFFMMFYSEDLRTVVIYFNLDLQISLYDFDESTDTFTFKNELKQFTFEDYFARLVNLLEDFRAEEDLYDHANEVVIHMRFRQNDPVLDKTNSGMIFVERNIDKLKIPVSKMLNKETNIRADIIKLTEDVVIENDREYDSGRSLRGIIKRNNYEFYFGMIIAKYFKAENICERHEENCPIQMTIDFSYIRQEIEKGYRFRLW